MAQRLVSQPAQVERLRLARDLGVSPSVLHGRVVTELHQHFDTTGNPTGTTLVKREPEWSDDDRAQLLALAVYEGAICACGFHESLTSDKSNYFQPEFRSCPVCAAADQWSRVQAKADAEAAKARGENAPPLTPHPEDGRRLFVKRLSPTEVEARRARNGRAVDPGRGSSPGRSGSRPQ